MLDCLRLERQHPSRTNTAGDGYSIYNERVERHGELLHHIKLFYADTKKAAAHFAAGGYPVIQSGRYDEDEHYYLDTERDFGYILELGNAGKIRPGVVGSPREVALRLNTRLPCRVKDFASWLVG